MKEEDFDGYLKEIEDDKLTLATLKDKKNSWDY